MSVGSLSSRARLAVAAVAVAGLGLGVAPLASASPTTPGSVPVLKIASTYQGVPYRWGGTTTHGFDCSGYVQFVFSKLGVKLPRTAEQQYEATRHLKASQLQLGDLVFFGRPGRVYHVGIYAGEGMFWDAPHTGSHVRLQKIWAGTKVYGRVRGLPSAVVIAPLSAPSQLPILLAPLAPAATDTPSPGVSTDPATSPAPTADTATPAPAATTAQPMTTPASVTPSASPSGAPMR